MTHIIWSVFLSIYLLKGLYVSLMKMIQLWILLIDYTCTLVLPNISVVGVGEKDGVAWQSISAISLQQSLNLWQYLSQ